MEAAQEALQAPLRPTHHREPRGLQGRPGLVPRMDLPRSSPPVTPPRNPRMKASRLHSDPCKTTTQTYREAERSHGTEALRPPLQLPLQPLLRCLLNPYSQPQGRRTTTSVCFLTSLSELSFEVLSLSASSVIVSDLANRVIWWTGQDRPTIAPS